MANTVKFQIIDAYTRIISNLKGLKWHIKYFRCLLSNFHTFPLRHFGPEAFAMQFNYVNAVMNIYDFNDIPVM